MPWNNRFSGGAALLLTLTPEVAYGRRLAHTGCGAGDKPRPAPAVRGISAEKGEMTMGEGGAIRELP